LLKFVASGVALAARGVFAALFPSDCRICDRPLENVSRLPVCAGCLSAMRPVAVRTCEICGEGLPAAARGEISMCPACNEERPHFTKAVAYGAYDNELRDLIHLLKYDHVIPAAGALGKFMARAIEKLEVSSAVLVVPVPLHSSKRRQRRFNQAELIARAALRQIANFDSRIAPHVLVRMRSTVSQIGLTRPQRRENMRGAFQARHLSEIRGREILLIDDVLTTGTTASECARVLRKAGASEVWVATVARTFKQSSFESSLESSPQMDMLSNEQEEHDATPA
jgi:ComF family protein